MHEIKCPNCGKTFNLDETGYADILSQVRDDAFDKALHERLALAEQIKKPPSSSRRQESQATWRKKPRQRTPRLSG
jgi:hypothetical protein